MQPDARFGVEKIKNEYRRIDQRWLQMHFQAMLWLVLIATAIEVGMCFVLVKMDLIAASTRMYFLKYVLTPIGANLLLVTLTNAVMKSPRCTQRQKIYTISLMVAVCSLVVYTIHSVFTALFLIFAIPLILTIIYGDQRLTTLVAAICLSGKVIADLFIYWDPDRISVFADKISLANFFISLAIMAIFYGLCLFMLRVEQEKNNVSIKLERERLQAREDALTDALTGTGNRQALREAFREMEQSGGEDYALAMMDLDDFKSLNDAYGHTRGDAYLRELGQALRSLEEPDIRVFRFGGDEFCMLFRGEACRRVTEVCGQVQSRFAASAVNQKFLRVSVSIGTAAYRTGTTPANLLERADAALYRAKQEKGSLRNEGEEHNGSV